LIEIVGLRKPTTEQREYDEAARTNPEPRVERRPMGPITLLIVIVIAIWIAYNMIKAFG